METVVFDKCFKAMFRHKTVIFLRAVSGICRFCRRVQAIPFIEGLNKRNVGQSVCRIREKGKVCNELVFGSNLQVIARFCLSVIHGILFHPHECGVLVGF